MASKLTEMQLEQVTDYLGFESFCSDLMIRCGYPNIEPLGGFKDKGRDAIHINRTEDVVTLFSYTVRADWKKKLYEDLEKIKKHGHECDEVVFVSNQNITSLNRDRAKSDVKEKYGWDLEVYSLKRVATSTDKNPKLKSLHPTIFFIDASQGQFQAVHPLDTKVYAEEMLKAFAQWQERYTPLLAEYLEFELFAVDIDSEKKQRIPITSLPNVVPIAALLGESGVGKTTTLWKLMVEASQKLKNGNDGRVPVYVELRNWSRDTPLRGLVQNAFASVDVNETTIENLLVAGRCLLLIDGLNELPPNIEQRDLAGRDIRNFYAKYSDNKFLFTCRTTDFDPGLIDVFGGGDSYPPNFEVQRLSREQVSEYVHRVFHKQPERANSFLEELDIGNDKIWTNENAFLHLLRIPMYLQMTLDEYKRSSNIPTNKGSMLRNFVARLIQRDNMRQVSKVPLDTKEEILGSIAYSGVEAGLYISLPKTLIQKTISQAIRALRDSAAIPQEVVVSDILDDVLSVNFLTVKRKDNPRQVSARWDTAEWLHQVILDYFLAQEMIKILVDPGTEKGSELLTKIAERPGTFDQPCQMALGLLDIDSGKFLYEKLITTSLSLSNQVLGGISEEHAESLVLHVVEQLLQEPIWDKRLVSEVSLFVTSVSVVNSLAVTFKVNADVEERRTLARILCEIAIRFEGTYAAKRALNVCEAWRKNKDDEVSFYAAKALWGRDRGATSETFRRLLDDGSPKVKQMVQGLMNGWRMDEHN